MFKRRNSPSRVQRGMVSDEELFAESEAVPPGQPGMTPPSAVQVGAFLRQMREQQGLSIGEMARRTHVRDVYLLALEAGDVEKLPGSTFVAGFLRLYAENLDLEDRSFIERYLETSGGEANLHTELFPAPTTVRHRPSVLMVLGGVIGLLLLFFVYENYFSRSASTLRTPELPSTAPLRAGSLPPGSGRESADLAELPPVEEEEKGGFVSGFLGHFFDQPAKKHWEEEVVIPPPPAPPPPVTAKAGGGSVTRQETVEPKKKSVPSEPIARGVDKGSPVPVPQMSQKGPPEGEKPRGDAFSFMTGLAQQGREWFDRVTTWPAAEGEQKPEGWGEGAPPSGVLPPKPASPKKPGGAEGVPPAQPAPVSPSSPQTAAVPAKPVVPERSSKGIVPDLPPRVVAPLPAAMVAAPPPPAKAVVVEPPAKVSAPPPPPLPSPPPPPAKVSAPPPPPPAKVSAPPPPPPPPAKAVVVEPPVKPVAKGGDPAVVIAGRYQEKVNSKADLQPEAEQAVSLLANEMVWVQILDERGQVMKDMVMQPNHLFRVPMGGRFFAVLGNAGAVRLRVGSRELPYLGTAGEELQGVDLSADALLRRAKP